VIRARSGPLKATTVEGDEVPGLIDEIPILAVAAALADGTTTFRDAGELRVKESDRIAAMVAGLRALGAAVEPLDDGLVVIGSGGKPLTGLGSSGEPVDAQGDHRVAMALAVAALEAANDTGPVAIAGWESVATSYPTFEEDLRRCQSP
jgi:3-phosphoshikimate 1-carboxyvinyltransferase